MCCIVPRSESVFLASVLFLLVGDHGGKHDPLSYSHHDQKAFLRKVIYKVFMIYFHMESVVMLKALLVYFYSTNSISYRKK